MASPVKNFTDTVGLSSFGIAPAPVVGLIPQLPQLITMKQHLHVFFKWGLTSQFGIVTDLQVAPSPVVTGPPLPPMSRQIILTFPPIYKERSGRMRPLKGQLWPRTR